MSRGTDMELDFGSIRAAIERLKTVSPQPDVFGAKFHRFVLNAPIPSEEVTAFETKHGVRLPSDYRQFLIEVGNGGAGPHYGLFPLGTMMDMRSLVRWQENDGAVGDLSEPFPHSEPWNDLSDEPTEEDERDDQLYQEKVDKFYNRYFASRYMNGAIPISDLGCALSHWLVVSGSEVGNVWCDYRGDYTGILPLSVGKQSRITFSQWYLDWLRDAIGKLDAASGY